MLIKINGNTVQIEPSTSVAAALISSGITAFRTSVSGEPRAALCGMGICFECRIRIDGEDHLRSCQITVREGMEIET